MKKIDFIPGLGEKPYEYKALSKYLNIVDIDWNTGKINLNKMDTLIGFSMGCDIAYMYAEKHKLKTLILCSPTPGTETLANLKVENVICIIGEKEKWVLKDWDRVKKTLPCKNSVIIVSGAKHKITGDYKKKLLEVVLKIGEM